MNESKNYRVSIFGDQYNLLSDESQERVVQSAVLIDSLMKEIAEKTKLKDVKKIAVLAGLQMASKILHLESKMEKNRQHEERLIANIDQELFSIQAAE